jgi:putative ABC transport system substrate-binding protein
MSPDVIVTLGSPALRAVRQQTRTIPVVFTFVADPVVQGFIESLARPGGNVTGFTNFEFAFAGKWLEALKEIRPQVSEVLMLVNPDNPGTVGLSRFITSIAPTYAIEVVSASVRDAAGIERAIASFQHAINRGIIILPDGLPVIHRDLIIELVNRSRLPAVFPFRTFPINGGLMSWGPISLRFTDRPGLMLIESSGAPNRMTFPFKHPQNLNSLSILRLQKHLNYRFRRPC